jgi:hypothetical protein
MEEDNWSHDVAIAQSQQPSATVQQFANNSSSKQQ